MAAAADSCCLYIDRRKPESEIERRALVVYVCGYYYNGQCSDLKEVFSVLRIIYVVVQAAVVEY